MLNTNLDQCLSLNFLSGFPNDWFAVLLFGLNFQVEHHLFPKVSHVHYPVLNIPSAGFIKFAYMGI
ncbi:fatty acid desaturase [Sphingobacterium sp. SGR-19]|uniref:fatty acid desaturase n=1 Tax=Sphingobacterium sp. SGR-19 TaxID=2710886 RepID=UPI0019D20C8E|nr:fatty acid desaturase [Sphingobacterium sp. SGR-19]